jgi:predicted Rossmann fold nucleotide-binding protein DprA/Smf involved in DNA uptake
LLKVVAERSTRDAIRDDRLTVATPYDPELGFAIGRAMGRNKIIYGLADHAVIVQFTPGKGGTWEGAVDRLGHNQKGLGSVPVFVRVTNDAEDGWLKLRNLGAHSFPVEEWDRGQITSVLTACASGLKDSCASQPGSGAAVAPIEDGMDVTPAKPAEPEHAVGTGSDGASETPQPPAADDNKADTCYHRCLALLLEELRTEPSRKELAKTAKRLDLVPKQFDRWLNQALDEGKVRKGKKERTIVFVNAALVDGEPLFSGTRP